MTTVIGDYTARTIDQPPDCVLICPIWSSYIIVGTYSLKEQHEHGADANTPSREGSLRILPISFYSEAANDGLQLDRKDFACGIYDIHFHPQDETLLGASTSDGRIMFYRFIEQVDAGGDLKSLRLVPLGDVIVEQDDNGTFPIVTQFTWISNGTRDSASNTIEITLAACTQFGSSMIVQVSVPDTESALEEHCTDGMMRLEPRVSVIHSQTMNLEAWTLAVIPRERSIDLYSGGDDGCLIASRFSFNDFPDESVLEPNMLFTDTRNHEAGVVAVLPLIAENDPQTNTFVLTGSYDEYLRVIEVKAYTHQRVVVGSVRLNGGVWTISILDSYLNSSGGTDYILLISIMHGGVVIVRLTATTSPEKSDQWCFVVETEFTAGHTSMVYACAARMEYPPDEQNEKKWLVVSTSFYDKQICTWTWVDHQSTRGFN